MYLEHYDQHMIIHFWNVDNLTGNVIVNQMVLLRFLKIKKKKKFKVIGQRCDQCEPGFYNISSGSGCHSCGCDPLGSLDAGVCDLITGQVKD